MLCPLKLAHSFPPGTLFVSAPGVGFTKTPPAGGSVPSAPPLAVTPFLSGLYVPTWNSALCPACRGGHHLAGQRNEPGVIRRAWLQYFPAFAGAVSVSCHYQGTHAHTHSFSMGQFGHRLAFLCDLQLCLEFRCQARLQPRGPRAPVSWSPCSRPLKCHTAPWGNLIVPSFSGLCCCPRKNVSGDRPRAAWGPRRGPCSEGT